jgi:diaminopimelate decarboxylase
VLAKTRRKVGHIHSQVITGSHVEGVSYDELARRFGTPLYVYSQAAIVERCQAFREAMSHVAGKFYFAVKSNSNLSILRLIFSQGFGADIVSIGELERCLVAGLTPEKIVFSGVGKARDEICRALSVGIFSFHVESMSELDLINELAGSLQVVARITLRVNPKVDAMTHEKISTGSGWHKFGIDSDDVVAVAQRLEGMQHCRLVGISCHIGSQILRLEPVLHAAKQMNQLAHILHSKGVRLEYVGLGGGLGIRYDQENPPPVDEYVNAAATALQGIPSTLALEPGRAIVGNAGVLLTRVVHVKRNPMKKFFVVDASMSELLRPALYGAYHDIWPVGDYWHGVRGTRESADVVGPVCETSDVLGLGRNLPMLDQNSLIVIGSCGAYGAVMASNYNTRSRPAEVMVSGHCASLIRSREPLAALWAAEINPAMTE